MAGGAALPGQFAGHLSQVLPTGCDPERLSSAPVQRVLATAAWLHLAAKSRASNVPLLLVFVPMRSQAVLLKHHADFPDTAPLALNNAVRNLAHDAGVRLMDFTPTLAAAKDMNPLYYAIDDHVTGEGSALLAKQLSDVIVEAHYPGLTNCHPIQAASVTN